MKTEIKSYKDLHVWQEAMELVALTYKVVKKLPQSEKFAMVQQMTRAAVSVPANIAEGHGSSHRKGFLNHLSISKGSLMELETYILLTEKLEFLGAQQIQDVQKQSQMVGRLLNGLIRSLKGEH